jgi:photosystem II stability/assembly factor-like uncharacterized protein
MSVLSSLNRHAGRTTVLAAVALSACALVLAAVVAVRARANQRVTPLLFGIKETPGNWVSIGPTPMVNSRNPNDFDSGRIASIAVDPSNVNHWLIGAGGGGVWETRDTGRTWAPLADTAPTLSTGAVTFAPSDPNVIYVGTGEPSGNFGMGILKSTDGGKNWSLVGVNPFNRATVKRVRVHPTNANVVMAATQRGGYGRDNAEGLPSPPPFGIWKSTDGGVTWTRKLGGQATALEIDPANFNNQYAAIGDQRLGVILNDPPGSAVNGIYRSSDGGETWSLVDGPWGTVNSSTRSNTGNLELAIAPSNSNTIYAGIQIPPNGGAIGTGLLGLYRTDNAWSGTPTWIRVDTGPTGPGGYCGPNKCGYSHVLIVDPGDANRLFAGASEQGYWRCTNCGSSPSWTNVIANVPVHPDFHAAVWAGNRLIIGNDGGVYSSTDFGATWQSHNVGLSTLMFFAGALHPSDPTFILGGLRDFTPSFPKGGNAWQFVVDLPTAGEPSWGEAEVAISASRPATDWMVAGGGGNVARTTDGGQSHIVADGGIDKAGAAHIPPVRKCPSDDNVFLTGTYRMWRTNNFFSSTAPSWTGNSPAPPNFRPLLANPETILSIAYIASDTKCNSYAFGNSGGQVQLTQDGGATWTDLDPRRTLPGRPINSLAFDPTNANILYAAVSSFEFTTAGQPGHVFKTTNALAPAPVWSNASPPSDTPFNVVAVDPKTPQRLYAGSDLGLWHSNDGGGSWVKDGLDVGLPNVPIYDIQINSTTNRTVISTYGRGVYVLTPSQ